MIKAINDTMRALIKKGEYKEGVLITGEWDDTLMYGVYHLNNKEEYRDLISNLNVFGWLEFNIYITQDVEEEEVIKILDSLVDYDETLFDRFHHSKNFSSIDEFIAAEINHQLMKNAPVDEVFSLDSLFEETDFQGFGSINDLNRILVDPIKIIGRDDFVKKHKADPSYTLDGLVARISVVYALSEAYIIYFKNGTFIEVYHDGRISKNAAVPAFKMTMTDSHSRIVNLLGYNSSIFAEKLIGIAISWLTNQLPETFTGLVVNVKDGSGTLETARKLGIPVDLSPYNLEWTLPEDNIAHGRRLMSLAKRTGKVYRFSANDRKLKEVYQLKDDAALRDYMDAHYPVVRDYKGGEILW